MWVEMSNSSIDFRYSVFRAFSPFLFNCLGSSILIRFACPQAGFPAAFHIQQVRDTSLPWVSKGQERTFLKVFSSHLLVLLAEIQSYFHSWINHWSACTNQSTPGIRYFNHKCCMRKGWIPQQNWGSVKKDERENGSWQAKQQYPPLLCIMFWEIALFFS